MFVYQHLCTYICSYVAVDTYILTCMSVSERRSIHVITYIHTGAYCQIFGSDVNDPLYDKTLEGCDCNCHRASDALL